MPPERSSRKSNAVTRVKDLLPFEQPYFVLRMRQRDHDISLLVALLHVRERFRDPFQGVTSVNDGLQLSSCGKLSDEIHSRRVFHGHAPLEFLSSLDGGPKDSTNVG